MWRLKLTNCQENFFFISYTSQGRQETGQASAVSRSKEVDQQPHSKTIRDVINLAKISSFKTQSQLRFCEVFNYWAIFTINSAQTKGIFDFKMGNSLQNNSRK